MIVSLPVVPIIELRAVLRRQISNGPGIERLSRRHLERAIGRLICAVVSVVVGLSAIRSPVVLPTGLAGWLVLIGIFALPLYLFQIDGLRDLQLRHELEQLAA